MRQLARGDILPSRLGIQLAALAIRISIPFDLTAAGIAEERKQVNECLRIITGVPEHLEFMSTSTSSEPLLAEAAARLLNGHETTSVASLAPRILSNALDAFWVCHDESGGLVARMLLTISHDLAARSLDVVDVLQPIYHRPIALLDLLRELFEETWHASIFAALPLSADPDQKLVLKDAFKDAYVNFSHFAHPAGLEPFLMTNLSNLAFRGMAYHRFSDEGAFSVVIPIVFGNPVKEAISELNCSVLQVAVRTEGQKLYPDVEPILPNPIRRSPKLSITMELGHQRTSVDIISHPRASANSGTADPNGNHFCLVAYGASSKVYAAIPPSEDNVYETIFAKSASYTRAVSIQEARKNTPLTRRVATL